MDPQVIPIDDRGFLLGDGLFETVLFQAGKPVLWDAHVERLGKGCAALGLPLPDGKTLRAEADRAIKGRRLGSARWRSSMPRTPTTSPPARRRA